MVYCFDKFDKLHTKFAFFKLILLLYITQMVYNLDVKFIETNLKQVLFY